MIKTQTASYTLERHLEKISLENKEFEILDSIWKLNKRTLTSALSAISFNFPHYSQHETSHSITIISNIESFLGEERIKKLEPTDTWLLLMSAYSHDLGMIILNKTIEDSLPNNTLFYFLVSLSDQNQDIDLKEAAKLLLFINKEPLPIDKSIFELRKSIVYVIGEFFRKGHAERSKEIIEGVDGKMRELLSNFYSDLIPNRFLNLLSEISYSHGEDFSYILNNLQYESNGISRDKMHPRFIASMLRFGDLLDVDDKRFNPISELLLDNNLPYISNKHKIKHASVKHLLITPTSVEATVDCPNHQVYRIARQWFDWLENDVECQYRNWSIISPPDFISQPPQIKYNGVKVLFNGTIADPDLMNLRFSINPPKAIEIFEGKGIYEDTSFVFLRELVQNAVDASKLQLWKDIVSGNYNELLFESFTNKYKELNRNNISTVKDYIKYPSDIPIEVYRNYQVDLIVGWADDDKKNINIKVIDKGSGISRKDLLRMTQNVGESRSNDIEYQTIKKTLPYWLKPTGAFGLGLQSVFLVTDSFVVKTKADNDISYEIVFNSSKNGEYSYIKSKNAKMQRGTTVEVVISEDNFLKAFGNTYSLEIIIDYDYFSSDDSVHISKIEEYVNKTLINIEELNVYILDKPPVKRSIYTDFPNNTIRKTIPYNPTSSNGDIGLSCNMEGRWLTNILDITGELGSQIKISFLDNFDRIYKHNEYSLAYNNLYLVRDIPINDTQTGFNILQYCAIQWNLLNPDSDKILNISRSKLLQEVKDDHNRRLLKEILPKILDQLWNAYTDEGFIAELNNNFNIDYFNLNITLYHIMQTSLKFGQKRNIPSSFKTCLFPKESICYKENDNAVNFDSFLSCTEFSILKLGKGYNERVDLDAYIKTMLNSIKENSETDIIALYQDYFSVQTEGFNLEEIKIFKASGEDMDIQLLKYNKNTSITKCTIMPNELKKTHLKNIIHTIQKGNIVKRHIIPSIDNFHETLSVTKLNYTLSQNHRNYHLHQFHNFIISPIKNNCELETVLSLYDDKLSKEELSDEIYNKAIQTIVPEKLINWIITDKTTYVHVRTKDDVLRAYSQLLAEALITNNAK